MKRLSIPKGYVIACRVLVLAAFLGGLAGWADVKIEEVEARLAATKKPTPEYPPIAKQMHLSGKVELDVTIAEDGSVESATIKLGNPILGGAAVAALKQWKFTPFTAQGKAIKATTVLTIDFLPLK